MSNVYDILNISVWPLSMNGIPGYSSLKCKGLISLMSECYLHFSVLKCAPPQDSNEKPKHFCKCLNFNFLSHFRLNRRPTYFLLESFYVKSFAELKRILISYRVLR